MKKPKSLFLLAILLLLVLCGCTEEKSSVQATEPPSRSEPVTETGSSVLQEISELPETPEIPETPAPPVAPALSPEDGSEEEAEEPEVTYILNANTKKFHKPTCRSVEDIAPKNYRESTKPRDEIISDGYKPCKNCNP